MELYSLFVLAYVCALGALKLAVQYPALGLMGLIALVSLGIGWVESRKGRP